ncbi:uncharacterized protein [Argopecten irradians]|uniref:uncharacterized protein n=1 Tax=Argopecten irradians TaxID=31199 RepID=UPI00371A7A16
MSAGQQNFSFVAGHKYREKMEEKELEVDDYHEDPIFLNRVIRTGMKEIGVESMEGNKFDELMVHIKKMCPGIDLNRSEKMNFIRKKIQNRLKYLERTQHARSDVRKRKDSLEKVEILTEDEMAVESLNKETVVSGESALEGPSNRMAAKGHQDVEDEEGFIDSLKAHSTPMKGSDHSGNHSTVELPVINKITRTGIEMFDVKSSQDSNSDDLMKYIQKMFPDIDLNSPEMIDSVREKIHNSLQCLGQLQPTRSSVGTGEANNILAEILTENETAAESLNKETETVVLGVSALEGPSNKMDVEGHQGKRGDEDSFNDLLMEHSTSVKRKPRKTKRMNRMNKKDESDESDESEIFETLDNSALNTLVRKGIEKFKLKNLKEEKMDKLMKYIKKKCPSTEAIKPETTKEIRKKVSQRLRTLRFLQSGGPSYRRNSENATRGAETSLTLKTLKKLRFVPKPIPKDKLRAKLKVSLFHEGHAVATGKILQYPLQTYDIEDFKREEFAQLKITKIRKFTNVTVPVLPYPKDKRSWANMKKGNTIIWPLKDLCSHSAFLKNMRTGRLARQLQRSGRKSSSEISEILTDAKITAEAVAIQEKDLIMEVMDETSHDGDLEDVNVNNDSDSDYLEVSESDEFAESDESEILESLDKSSLNTLVRKGIEKFGVKTLKEEKTDKLMKYIQEKCPATDSPEMRKEIRKKISQRLRTWRCLQSDREYSEAAMRRTENTPDHLILKKLHFVPKLIPKDKLRAKLKVSLFNDGHAVALGEIIQYPLWKYDIEDSMREEFAQLEITKTRRYTRVPVLPYPKDKRSWEKIKKGNTIIWPVKDLHSVESYEKGGIYSL